MDRRLARWAALAAVLVLLGMIGVAVRRLDGAGSSLNRKQASSHAAFEAWLRADPARSGDFAQFEAFLTAHGVADVVPAWQLARTDTAFTAFCRRPAFLIPPRDKWDHIVPVLKLVKHRIVPRVGRVEVMSSYRTEAFNTCVGGASRSRHLSFSALDLVARDRKDVRAVFRDLCALQRELGPASQFGLGAYFDPDLPIAPNSGRFHVDVAGFRSWGYSKRAGSSGCRHFSSRR